MTAIPQIDELKLDKGWLEQPGLVAEWGEKLAEARRDHDVAKTRLDITKAKLDNTIRSGARDTNTKMTEKQVECKILTMELYQKAAQEVIDAKYEVDKVYAIVNHLDDRKKALENLVRLYIADYYSDPRIPECGPDDVDKLEKNMHRHRAQRQHA